MQIQQSIVGRGKSMVRQIVVYTAISGDYDFLKDPEYITENCDYVCFTDNPKLKSKVWMIKPFPEFALTLDKVRRCRYVKIMPHILFPNYQYSVWVDGSIDIIGNVNELLEKYFLKANHVLVTFKHPLRDCIYVEAETCKKLLKDDIDIIDKQIDRYKKFGLPEHVGLIESNVMLRKHNNQSVIELMEAWWYEVNNFSKRDQLSFNFVAWRYKFSYSTLDGNSRDGSYCYFKVRTHKQRGFRKVWQFIKIHKDTNMFANIIYIILNPIYKYIKKILYV